MKYCEKSEVLACSIPHRSFHGDTGDQGHAESTSGRDIGVSVESGGGSHRRVVAAPGIPISDISVESGDGSHLRVVAAPGTPISDISVESGDGSHLRVVAALGYQ